MWKHPSACQALSRKSSSHTWGERWVDVLQSVSGVQGTQFDIDSMQVTSDDVSQCTPSVECSSWHDEAAAVVAIYAIDMRLGAMGLCTGTVVNAPQGRKYLLTADHCFIGEHLRKPSFCMGLVCKALLQHVSGVPDITEPSQPLFWHSVSQEGVCSKDAAPNKKL